MGVVTYSRAALHQVYAISISAPRFRGARKIPIERIRKRRYPSRSEGSSDWESRHVDAGIVRLRRNATNTQ